MGISAPAKRRWRPFSVLTGHGDVAVAVRAMKAGVVDFLEKPFETDVLAESIARAFERLASSKGVVARAAEAEIVLGVLTNRERDVLQGLAEGYPNKTIAYDLGISSRTVEVHRANIMTKLKARSLSEVFEDRLCRWVGRGPALTRSAWRRAWG